MYRRAIEEIVREKENQMWEAFARGDSTTFSKLVAQDAMMICGGSRESGQDYAMIVEQVRLDSYEICDFVTKKISSDSVITNYVVSVICPDPSISGTFRVSSLWKLNENNWELVFNQDSKLP